MNAINTNAPDTEVLDTGERAEAPAVTPVSALVAIEEERLRASLVAFLRAEGLTPDEADTLAAARRLLKRGNYGVVFAAEQINGLSPADTVARLRSQPGGAHTRIVAVSRNRQPDRRALAAAGFDHVLSPTSDADEIAAQYLSARSAIPVVTAPAPAVPDATDERRAVLEGELAQLQAAHAALQSEMESLATLAGDLQANTTDRDTELAPLRDENATLQARLEALATHEAALQSHLAARDAERDAELTRLRDENASVRSQLESLAAQETERQSSADARDAEQAAELARLRDENTELQSRLDALAAQASELHAAVNSRAGEHDAELTRLRDENMGLQATLETLATRDADQQMSALAREAELRELADRMQQAETGMSERDELLRQSEEQLAQQHGNLTYAEQQIGEQQELLRAAEARYAELHTRQTAEADATFQAALAQVEASRVELAATRQELNEQASGIEAQREKLEHQRAELSGEQEALAALRSEIDAAAQARDEAAADLERQRQELSAERADLQSHAAQLSDHSAGLATLSRELEEERTAFDAERVAAEERLRAAEADADQKTYLATLRTLAFYLARGNHAQPDRQAQHALHAITTLIPDTKTAVWLRGDDGQVALVRSSGLHPRYGDLAQPIFQALADAEDGSDGEPRFVHNTQSSERPLGELAIHENFNLAIHIPLVSADGVVGALAAYVEQPDTLGDDQIAVLHTVGDTLAATLSRPAIAEPLPVTTTEAVPPAATGAFSVDLLPEAAFTCDASGRILSNNQAFTALLDVDANALVGRTIHDLLWSDDAERIADELARLRGVDQPAASPMLLDLHRPGGDVVPVDLVLSQLPVHEDPDTEPAMLGTVRDMRGKERDGRERNALLEIARLTGPQSVSPPLDDVLQSAIGVLTRQLGIERAAVWRTTEDGRRVVPRAAIGLDDVRPVAAGEGMAGSVARDRRPRFVPDSAAEPELRSSPDVTSAFGLPLLESGRLAGVLTVETTGGRTLDARDEDVLTVVAAHLAGTIGRMETQRQLAQQAATDPLTGLANRQAFQNALDVAVARNRRGRISVLIVGVDAFKGVNEIYGHDTADAILQQIGQLLRTRLRQDYLLARYTSDQFAILLPGVNRDEAVSIAENLRIAIAMQLFTAAEQVEQLTISIGAATRPDDASTAQGLIQAADHAMYLAKRAGRNQTFQSNAAFATLAPAHGRLNDMLRQSPRETLSLLIRAMDQRLPERAGHSERVTRYALAIGREMGVAEQEIPLLRLAAYIHDIGMVSLPDSLLRKPTSLSPQERELLRGVPVAAHGLLAQLDLPSMIPLAVLHQRESFDGSGYPDGLQGDAIPLGARIIAVADALDAMTSARAHREPMSMEQALDQVESQGGTQFDPAVAQAARVLTGVVSAPVAAPGSTTTELSEATPTQETDELPAVASSDGDDEGNRS